MTDERYEFLQDCAEKASTAKSANNKRTHCGKGGKVRFPSDNLTKKEREAMNSECKTYRMNDPVKYSEFKTWPKEHQITYIKRLREKYGVPDKYIAEMMGTRRPVLCELIVELGIGGGKGSGGPRKWDRDGFYAWFGGIKEETIKPIEPVIKEREAMNSECKTYRMNDPVKWSEFKTWPKEHQITYIKLLREKFGVPDSCIGAMMGISKSVISHLVTKLGIGVGYKHNSRKVWDKDGFYAWCGGIKEEMIKPIEPVIVEEVEPVAEPVIVEEEPEITSDIPVNDTVAIPEHSPITDPVTIVPESGELKFRGNANDILRTVSNLLNGEQVKMKVEWEVLD